MAALTHLSAGCVRSDLNLLGVHLNHIRICGHHGQCLPAGEQAPISVTCLSWGDFYVSPEYTEGRTLTLGVNIEKDHTEEEEARETGQPWGAPARGTLCHREGWTPGQRGSVAGEPT